MRLIIILSVRIELEELPKNIYNSCSFKFIEHKFIFCKYYIEQTKFCQYIYLIVFNFFLLKLACWLILFLEKRNKNIFHSSSLPNFFDVARLQNKMRNNFRFNKLFFKRLKSIEVLLFFKFYIQINLFIILLGSS